MPYVTDQEALTLLVQLAQNRLMNEITLDDDDEREILWLAEAERRDLALDRGELESIPAETEFAGIRSLLR